MMTLLSAAHGGPAAAGPSPAGVPEIEYPSPLAGLPDEPVPFVVRNTFVDTAEGGPSSLLGSSVPAPRAARSCPGSRRACARGFESCCEEVPSTHASRSTSSAASAAGDADLPSPGQDGLAGTQSSTLRETEAPSHAAEVLPEFAYPAPAFSVRNTFIDTGAGQPSSMLDDAFEERRVRSCPSSGLGLPSNWVTLPELAARLEADDEEEFTPAPTAPSLCAEEGEDDFTPAPAGFTSRAEDENWHQLVPPSLLEWTSCNVFEEPSPWCLLQAQAVGDERLAPLSFMPPPPLAPPSARLGKKEARLPPPPPLAPPAMSDAAPASIVPALPLLGSPECPSVGSALHCQGACKPCAHFAKGCANGVDCQFCHLCAPGELKRRQKERRIQIARQEASERPADVGSSTRGRRGGQKARGRPSPGEPPAGVPSPMAPALECQTQAHV